MGYYAALAVIVVVTVTGWSLFAWQAGSVAVYLVVGSLLLAMFAEIAFDICRRHAGAPAGPDWRERLPPGGVVRFTAEGGFFLDRPGDESAPSLPTRRGGRARLRGGTGGAGADSAGGQV